MNKMTKRFAAIIAAVMTVSAMSGMSAFALATEHYTEGGTSQSATVDLQARVSSTTQSSSVGRVDGTKDDTEKHIWDVTISADTLTWDLVKNDNTAYKQNITWNPSTHTYDVTNGDVDTVVSTYSVASTDTAAKTVNVANNSNFDITSATAAPQSESACGATFSVTDPTGAIAIGANADTTIAIDVSHMSGFDSTDYVSVGTATITLTATGEIQARS